MGIINTGCYTIRRVLLIMFWAYSKSDCKKKNYNNSDNALINHAFNSKVKAKEYYLPKRIFTIVKVSND